MDTIQDTALMYHQAKRRAAVNSTLMLLFLADLIIVVAACHLALIARFYLLQGQDLAATLGTMQDYRLHISLAIISCCTLLYFRQCYELQQLARPRYGAVRILSTAFYWSLLFVSFSLFVDINPGISRMWVGFCGAFIGIGLGLWRYTVCQHLLGERLMRSIRRNTLVVGWNTQAQNFYERSLAADNSPNFFPFHVRSCVILDQHASDDPRSYPANIYCGDSYETIERQLSTGRHDTLIVANTNLPQEEILHLQEICGREMVDFMIMPDFIQSLSACLRVETFAGMPLLTQNQRAVSRRSNAFLKRCFDIAGSLFGLLVFTPIIAYFAWRVYRESPGSVFYRQVRTGQDGMPFEIIKIRSMRMDAEKGSGAQWCTEDDPRRLTVGAFMRKYNIDELPQFWNVLKGDMSLVGPRPERPELIQAFKHEISCYNVRHLVKPGVTGWAQVNGWRGDTCLNSRIACDLEYIERWNIWFDIYICFKTFFATKNAY